MGLGTATLGKIQGNAVDIGLRFEHENRLLESVDGHLGGFKVKLRLVLQVIRWV